MSNLTTSPAGHTTPAADRKLPVSALLALATAVFVTSLTETLPAGVLPAMSADLGVSESAAGQSVTIYAVGTALTAIPLSAATAGWRRKRLLLTAMAGFAVAGAVTAVSSNYPLTMASRFVAGVAAGLAWALLAGYARRLAPPHLQGKAVAIVMTGIPIALSLGVPAGTFLGAALGWRTTFTLVTVLAVVLIGWILAAVPDQPGRRPDGGRAPTARALTVPGVAPVLFVTGVFVLAHTVLYTYIATFLDRFGMGGSTDVVLLVFGAASMASIWVVGAHIDRRLRALTIASTVLFAVAATVLALLADSPAAVYLAVALWGLGWGGAPTLLQTAVADAGGEAADAAQAMLVTLWNAAMAGGGVAGGVLLDRYGPGSFPWSVLLLLVPVLIVVVAARRHGFPAARDRAAAEAGPAA
ncbi:MFS transporter [Allostreptomyces psammosilenae]|uniref:Putative MFS family arabinose efflux permease n=1 Tax=Allostreptomyces psammosilenae TaxID=1892865 RepID=A0A853A8R5_9ACTN|nr:MFS transporter [Allostreptomyces psammosilenae]NYI06918.1 putative MFS family arabinose efflux permease [Allostreptomyces psammosilenae]